MCLLCLLRDFFFFLKSAVEMDPSMADAWSNLGSAYHQQDHLEDALGW